MSNHKYKPGDTLILRFPHTSVEGRVRILKLIPKSESIWYFPTDNILGNDNWYEVKLIDSGRIWIEPEQLLHSEEN